MSSFQTSPSEGHRGEREDLEREVGGEREIARGGKERDIGGGEKEEEREKRRVGRERGRKRERKITRKES